MGQPSSGEILPTHTLPLFQEAIRRAAELLRTGAVVALPTETVYGLAANALDAAAVARIYEIKGRPAHNPIIVHVASLEMAKGCATDWPALADSLANAFWPGPLTLVLPKGGNIPNIVTAGGSTVGVRWPSHPFIQAVIQACGFPLAAPSANLSNRVSPTNAEHVREQLGDRLRLIVDGGQAQVGLESTVLDVTCAPPRILRPGMIHAESLAAVVGEISGVHGQTPTMDALRSPGLLPKHYAPKAKLLVLSWQDEHDLKAQVASHFSSSTKAHVIAHTRIPAHEAFAEVSVIPHDPGAFARALYAELHRCDAAGAELIVVEAPPQTVEWRAIEDRLNRAAAS